MCSAQRGWLPTALRLTSPAADRKEGARRAEGFGRATSGFLFSGLPWWQGAGSRGVHWPPEDELLKDVSTGPETRGKEASLKCVLFASTNEHYHVDSESSEGRLDATSLQGQCEDSAVATLGLSP